MVCMELDCERHLSDTLRTTACCHAAVQLWVVEMEAGGGVGERGRRCLDP